MDVQFDNSENDYRKFLKAFHFKKNLLQRLGVILILSLIIGSTKDTSQPFIFVDFFIKVTITIIILFLIFFCIPYLIMLFRLNKQLNKEAISNPKSILLQDDGISVTTTTNDSFWKWEVLQNAGILDNNAFFMLFTGKVYIVPLSAFNNESDAINFVGVIRSNIQKFKVGNKFRKVKNLYYWGLLGFVPNFGAIAGVVLIIKALQLKKIGLAAVGTADIAFTIVFWTLIFPKLNPNGFKDISQMELNNLVKNIEFYRLEKGGYPDNLQQLLKDDPTAFINDPIQTDNLRKNTLYNYKNLGDKYLLFSSGLDGIIDTKDDVYPTLSITDSTKVRFVKRNYISH